MGFLFAWQPGTRRRDPFKGVSAEFMAQAGCLSCPLQFAPKALNDGPEDARLFMLGEAPGKTEAQLGRPFVGPSGDLLRDNIPAAWQRRIRFGNVIQSFPGDAEPPPQAIAHCRGYLTADIEYVRPRAIFGFGNTPLEALTGQTGILKFAGRWLPVQVGAHRCWYFASVHPAYVLRAPPETAREVARLFETQLADAFTSLDSLPEPQLDTPAEARQDIIVGKDAGRIVGFLRHAMQLAETGFDYETDRLRPYGGGTILTAAVATPDATMSFPIDHPEAPWTDDQRAEIVAALVAYLEAPVVKLAHNAAFELEWTAAKLSKRALRPNRWGCSQAQAFLLDGRPRAHSLDFLCRLYFGLGLKELSPIDVTQLAETPVGQVCEYNGLDAKYHLKVFGVQRERLWDAGLMELYHHHIARIVALVRGQAIGLPVDLQVNVALTAEYQARLDAVTARLVAMPEVLQYEARGKRFNVAANKDVLNVLHGVGIHLDSSDEAVLGEVKTPFAQAVLEYRGIAKVLSTYLTPLDPQSPQSQKKPIVLEGRLHPIIATMHTRTWRTSSEDPNIQNWPQRDAEVREVRKQIKPPPGHWLVSVDYSGIQARNVAMESRDRRLVQAFIDRYDIHGDWSERIQRLAPKWAAGRPAKALRSIAKNKYVFPTFFGAQPGSVAHFLGVKDTVGYRLQEDFWSEFPDIQPWHRRIKRFYKENLYVTGLSGFRRHAPISENMLINTPIQSDEALLVCEALQRLSAYEDDALQPVMLIHDDLTFFVPDNRFDECLHIILQEMLRMEHPWLNVPLAVEVQAGRENWGEQVKIGEFESGSCGGYIEIGGH